MRIEFFVIVLFVSGGLGYSCGSGHDCISNEICNGKNITCDEGLYCTGDINSVTYCKSGFYCPSPKEIYSCPSGYYCPTGTSKPIKCGALSMCPKESYKLRDLLYIFIGIIAFLIGLAAIIIWRYYDRRRQETTARVMQATSSMTNFELGTLRESVILSDISLPKIDIKFENIGYEVEKTKGRKVTILEGVTGEFFAGQVSAIMGPSGSGKTSLMNLLSAKVAATSGTIYINGVEDTMNKFKKIMGFVPQDDIMLTNLSVREILNHSARTRLPYTMSDAQKMDVVSGVITLLKLGGVVNSVIGDEANRGISGGERKRVNIGIELVAQPSILFLDEPTSGLDASTSQEIMRFLTRIAAKGVNVIAVVHQPRYEIIQKCDNVMLLAKGGRTVYKGSVPNALTYFNSLGFPCPPHSNPMDHFIDVISGKIPQENNEDFDPNTLPQLWEANIEKYNEENFSIATTLTRSQANIIATRHTDGFFAQFLYYLGRCYVQQKRDLRQLGLELIYQILPGLSMGVTAMSQEILIPPVPSNIINTCPAVIRHRCINEGVLGDVLPINFFFTTMVSGAAACVIGSRTFGETKEKLNIMREHRAGMDTLAYFLAKCVYDSWNILRGSFVYLLLYFVMSDPPGSRGGWFISLFLIQYGAYGMSYVYGALFSLDKAIVASLVTAVTMSVTSGLSPLLTDINNYPPLPIIWWLSYCRWGAEALYIVSLYGNTIAPKDRLDTMVRAKGYNPGIMVLLAFFWRLVAYLILRFYTLRDRK